jgi:sugar fermentation stimulation protein A
VIVSDSGDVTRHHPTTWELIDMHGTWVGVNPTVSRKIVRQAILDGEIRSLRGYTIQSEALPGKPKRVDFILQNMKENCFINIQSVTWAERGCAWFPDSATEPPRKMLNDLTDIARQGHRAIALFHVLRGDCRRMKPAVHIDKEYGKALRRAKRAGVEIRVFRANVTPEEITLGVPIPFVFD